jgi:hypothetical protein
MKIYNIKIFKPDGVCEVFECVNEWKVTEKFLILFQEKLRILIPCQYITRIEIIDL